MAGDTHSTGPTGPKRIGPTPIGKVRGLGPAHEGTHHWLVQRFTAAGNLLLTIWFIASLMLLTDLSHGTLANWLSQPFPALAMALLVVSTFWHARLGLQVLVEDYVHDTGSKFALIMLLNLIFFAGAAFGVFSIVRLALAGAA